MSILAGGAIFGLFPGLGSIERGRPRKEAGRGVGSAHLARGASDRARVLARIRAAQPYERSTGASRAWTVYRLTGGRGAARIVRTRSRRAGPIGS